MTLHGYILSVVDEVVGDYIDTASIATATTLVMSSLDAFDEDGGTIVITDEDAGNETRTYSGFDETTLSLTGIPALTFAHASGTRVDVSPEQSDRVAYVQVDDPEREPVPCRVPFFMRDRIAEGQRSLLVGADDSTAIPPEEVLIGQEGGSWALVDVLRQDPAIAGEFLTIAPEDISDGVAPGAVAGLTLKGGVGFLLAQWTADTLTTDTVTYDVHVSVTTGFTPDGTTFYSEVRGTTAFIQTLPDDTALAYFETDGETPKPYYVKVIAKDADGTAAASAQATAAMAQVNTGDIAVNTITAAQIYAGSISTQYLGAIDSLISNLIAGDPNGQHVAIDADGLRVISTDGDTLVNLPTDETQRPYFNGDLIAQNLEVIGATILGATKVAKGTSVTLESTIAPPGAAPSVAVTYPATASVFGGTANPTHAEWYNLAYSAVGGTDGATPSFYSAVPGSAGYWRFIKEYRADTGAFVRTITLTNSGDDDCWGVVAIGTHLYVLFQRWSTGNYFIRKYLITDFSVVTTLNITSGVTSDKPGLGTDGTSPFMFCGASQASPANIRVIRYDSDLSGTGDNVTHNALTVDTRETGGDKSTEFSGAVKVGSVWYVSLYSYGGANLTRRQVYAFTGTITTTNGLALDTDNNFYGANGAEADGITHDGTNFYTILQDEEMTKHTSWTWAAATSSEHWIGYTWRDDTGSGEGTALGQKHETTRSPLTSITARKRAALQVSMSGTLPGAGGADDPTARRVYQLPSATSPAAGTQKLQATVTTASHLLETYNSGGAADPTSQTFPVGSNSSIVPSATDVAPLLADGNGFMPIGTVLPFAGAAAPTGWLLCNGASLHRSDTTQTVTSVASTDLFTASAVHGFVAGDAVVFTGLVGGAGLTNGRKYYVIAAGLTTTVFAVSETSGGSSFDHTTNVTAGNVRGAHQYLFAAISTTFGTVDSTHFNIPDTRSRALMGAGTYGALGANDADAEASRDTGHLHSSGTLDTATHPSSTVTPTGGSTFKTTAGGHAITGDTGTQLTSANFPHLSLNCIIRT